MEAASASPNLHPPCLQEIGSVEGNPFYCLCSLRTMCFCKALCAPTAAEQIITMTLSFVTGLRHSGNFMGSSNTIILTSVSVLKVDLSKN